MGFFSWKTQDTNKSIANSYSERPTFPVYMTDNEGNQWFEEDYEGYGVFGGKDYYELVAEMNDAIGMTGETDKDRSIGIRIALGLSAIENIETGQIIKSGGEDFFNWQTEIVAEGKCANDLVKSGTWKSITIFDKNRKLPNLNESKHIKWRDVEPESCERQGFFYD